MSYTEYAEVGTVIRLEDLAPFFTLSVENPYPSYLFQVPLPELNMDSYPWCCRFTGDDVEKIQRQATGVDMKCLTQGKIPLGTFLLFANSPRFPYTMHVSRARWNSDIPIYYDFILKKDIIIKDI